MPLVMQHAMRVRHIVIANYLMNGLIFGKNVIEHETCVLNFSTSFFVKNL